jgi:prefoldin subunit 5
MTYRKEVKRRRIHNLKKNKLLFDLQLFADDNIIDKNVSEEEEIDVPNVTEEENALNETLDQLTSENTDLRTQLEVALQKANMTDELMEKIIAFAQSLGILKDVESETSEKSEDIIALEAKIEELQGQIQTLTEENDSLTVQIAELKVTSLKELVDSIISRKIELGDITEEQCEDETQRLLSRSESSLHDTLDDLSQRKAAIVVPRVIERIENPALADNSQEGTIVLEKEEEIPTVKTPIITPREVFKELLTKKGPINTNKNKREDNK